MQEMQKFGAITLVRVPEGVMHFTFQDSVSAIHALQLDETEVVYLRKKIFICIYCILIILIYLKSPWSLKVCSCFISHKWLWFKGAESHIGHTPEIHGWWLELADWTWANSSKLCDHPHRTSSRHYYSWWLRGSGNTITNMLLPMILLMVYYILLSLIFVTYSAPEVQVLYSFNYMTDICPE